MPQFQLWYRSLPQALRWLLTINVAAYLLWALVFSHFAITAGFASSHLAFHTPWQRFLLEPWQLFTYSFVHLGTPAIGLGSLMHVGFNMLWLYWIGRDYENMHGPARLLGVYVWGSVGGALLSALAYALLPATVLGAHVAIIHGASASVLGVLAAVAFTYPQKRIGLLFIGNIRLVHLLAAFLVLDLLFRLGGTTAVFAHLGGALAGLVLVRLQQRGVDLTTWFEIFFSRDSGKRQGASSGRLRGWLTRMEQRIARKRTVPEKSERTERPHRGVRLSTRAEATPPSLDNEIDRILDKISEHGMESLTEEDREVLEKASRIS